MAINCRVKIGEIGPLVFIRRQLVIAKTDWNIATDCKAQLMWYVLTCELRLVTVELDALLVLIGGVVVWVN